MIGGISTFKVSHLSYILYICALGSLSYSWDECVNNNNSTFGGSFFMQSTPSNCVHFVQLNNYPTYANEFDFFGGATKWTIRPSLRWLVDDLNNTTYPVVINFHDFDSAFTQDGKQQLQRILTESQRNIQAIFFAHFHSNIGLHPTQPYWCINGRATPLMYTGSVPGNNYMVLRFRGGLLNDIYTVNVATNIKSTAKRLSINNVCS
jgi:hypothetical protein